MSKAKMPPVPPANRPAHGGNPAKPGPMDPVQDKSQAEDRDRNTEQQGQTGASYQNTHHKGYQQDR
ncbi:hypothetical protein [Sabulicella glaciei]|uniref:Uncharacterized protein n=1 Tax=Sabulicella glaciei TaxID=2984948 RepID=A0ABT3NT37_9PROT|nr:hypothetical protein [Roseococcus sp. MDT2-1-1]MCW8085043.1 hypothetical protein [Roseococcus sp. MDT2-1-1]